ncbi:hypothetical protein BDZ90DRAFT_16715 [Jaminaea rosea]|uniref:GYF domain-containing protein n=1 Tax=Jaminaea rosea TaxID=1569628 RepID=A0A316UZ90_9BASI|nr:hypothetical protein BDZ90DRAFT_16715 [Jaminaea rosea]PWN30532.1 hypothetical protein BDZ90DRAFT_16715 [Jaminaea rosea]
MTSSSLQFGPEWMRKPAHTKQQQGNSAATQHQNQHQPASNASAPQAKRHPSLGTMSPGGPTPVLTPTTAPSPGTFSFAAAAAGGMDRGASSNSGHSPSHSFSAAVPGGGSAALDRDAALRYARDQSLSLYSSKGSLSPSTEGQPMSADAASPSAVAANGSDTAHGSQSRKKASGERDGLKRLGSTEPLSPTLPSEPRGLNARGTTASSDRERPGLFQRASSGGSLGGTGVQRERFSGIQGGVLSGVAPPEQQRRRKESEGSSRLLKHPSATNTAHGEQQDGEPPLWDKRSGGSQLSSGGSEAFASAARMGRSKPSLDNMSIPQQDTGSDKAWTGGRRRERGPSENPGTGAVENAAGFAKFAGYDRKRERTGGSNADTWRSGSATRATPPENQAPDDDSHADPSGETVNDHHDAQPTQTLEQNFAGLDMNGSGAPAASPWSADAQQWLYRDPSGQVQGPFPAPTMQSWYEQEYFAQDLLIRPQEEADFHPLAIYFAAAGNNPRFFLAPPPSMRRPADEPPLAPSNGPQDSMFNLNGGQMPGADLGWNGKAGAVPGPGWLDNSLGRAGFAPSQAFGSPFGAFGGLPQSPFLSQPGMGTPGAGEHVGLDARLRQQEDYINAMRQREFEHHHQQQQQQQHPQMGPFDGHYAALDGWNRQPQLWQQSQQAVDQVNSSSHQQSSPWSTSAFPTGMVNDNTPTSAPWGEAPDQKQHQQQVYQPEANVGAIGTPVRARSPAPAPAEQQHALDQAAAQYESSNPAAVEDAPVEEVQEVRDEPAQVEEEPSRPATPPPAEDPAPEHEWPQSPSAVEFASEPDFGSTRDAAEAATTASGRVASDKKGVRGKAAISIPGKPGNVSAPSAAGGNVKVVGADQFRKGTAAESTSVQTPLSSLLGNNSPASSTASKAAPWAQTNNEEGSAPTNAAMSLREIQEAEAKQAEAKRAVERPPLPPQCRGAWPASLRQSTSLRSLTLMSPVPTAVPLRPLQQLSSPEVYGRSRRPALARRVQRRHSWRFKRRSASKL